MLVTPVVRKSSCRAGATLTLAAIALLGGCSRSQQRPRDPAQVRAQIVRLLPARIPDRNGWATDITAAFAALNIEPTTSNLCATLAITEQESNFSSDPVVPNLPRIALAEIDRRAGQHDVPQFLVHAALLFKSPNGKRYDERIAAVRTEQDMSRIYEDFMGSVPLGKRLFAGDNPIRTGGPMQVSVDFAEQRSRAYPYPVAGSIRHEVFTRRGGVYFGIAHLLGYPVSYPQMVYRFADYNAGFYASRNAAFQRAVSIASGIPIPLDGDLVGYGRDRNRIGTTEVAVRSLARSLDMSDGQIHRALQDGETARLEDSNLYQGVFKLAEHLQHRALPRATLPRITLESPKITRKLTTAWFATRVDQRYRRCMAKATGS